MSLLSLALTILALACFIAMLSWNPFIGALVIALGFGVSLFIAGVALMAGGLSRLCVRR